MGGTGGQPGGGYSGMGPPTPGTGGGLGGLLGGMGGAGGLAGLQSKFNDWKTGHPEQWSGIQSKIADLRGKLPQTPGAAPAPGAAPQAAQLSAAPRAAQMSATEQTPIDETNYKDASVQQAQDWAWGQINPGADSPYYQRLYDQIYAQNAPDGGDWAGYKERSGQGAGWGTGSSTATPGTGTGTDAGWRENLAARLPPGSPLPEMSDDNNHGYGYELPSQAMQDWLGAWNGPNGWWAQQPAAGTSLAEHEAWLAKAAPDAGWWRDGCRRGLGDPHPDGWHPAARAGMSDESKELRLLATQIEQVVRESSVASMVGTEASALCSFILLRARVIDLQDEKYKGVTDARDNR